MHIDVDGVTALRAHNAAWGLLRYEHAPVVLAFLHRVFVATNRRAVPMQEHQAMKGGASAGSGSS